jgi:hypothetical protein
MIKTKKKALKGKAFKIPAQPLDDQMIKYFVDYYKEHKGFPGSKIPCSVSGKLSTCMGPWMKKKIKEFGGPEQLLRNYVCRGAMKDQKVKVIKEKKEKKISKKKKIGFENTSPDEPKRYDIPKMNFEEPRPSTDAELSDISKSVCLRPDVFLSNGRHCDGCESYKLCQNSLRTLPKDIQYDGENFVYVEKSKKTKKK